MNQEVNKMNGNNFKTIDVLKFFLAITIVQIHSEFALVWMKPYLRLAVPLYFMISSFFFFRKKPDTEQLWAYVKRLSKLYLFWFIVWSPFYFYINRAVLSDPIGGGEG